MEIPQKNKLSMFLAVLGVMETYSAAWTTLTAIAGMVTRLTDLTDSIQTNSGIQGTPRTGIAQGKNRKQVDMINLTAEVAGDLHAWAVEQQDDILAGQTDVEVSDLVHLSDVVVGPRCRELYTLAQSHAAALIPYGTTAASLTALDAAITAYEAAETAPRQAIAVNTSVTDDIARDIAAGSKLLRGELDKAMRKFARLNPDFFHAYRDARVIVDLGIRHVAKPPTPVTPPAGA